VINGIYCVEDFLGFGWAAQVAAAGRRIILLFIYKVYGKWYDVLMYFRYRPIKSGFAGLSFQT
jgi:hypothetical protein